MDIDAELYQLKCIKNMGQHYLSKWENMKNVYAEDLDKGSMHKPIAFTSHDYSKHCFNIYKIISNELLNPNVELKEQEWFILNTAVLFHDYSMTLPNFDRLIHSEQSANWLMEQFNDDKDSVIRSNLSYSEAETVSLIIMAHSDSKMIKNNEEVITKKNLENEKLKEEVDCEKANNVRAKFLAAILRLADECDVTRSRTCTRDRISDLDESDPEQKKSKEHWKCLKYFKAVKRNGANLSLEVDDDFINMHSDDMVNIEERIKKVITKIRDQIIYVRRQVIEANDQLLFFFPLSDVKLSSTELSTSFMGEVNQEDQKKNNIPELRPQILLIPLRKKITDKINNEGLIKPGHYIVSGKYCNRDWIDVRDIIVDKELVSDILDSIVNDMVDNRVNMKENTIILGLEENGLILGAQVAYKMNLPFSYIVPNNVNNYKSSLQEKKINIDKYDHIILITDAISTFRTVAEVCKEHDFSKKIERIYTILFREPFESKFYSRNAKLFKEKVFACNDEFKMEVCERKNCKFTKCIAENS